MIQGFRKLVDIPADQGNVVLKIMARLASRRIRHTKELYARSSSPFFRIAVYARDYEFARDELNRMEWRRNTAAL